MSVGLDEVEDIRFQMGGSTKGRLIGFGSSRELPAVVNGRVGLSQRVSPRMMMKFLHGMSHDRVGENEDLAEPKESARLVSEKVQCTER